MREKSCVGALFMPQRFRMRQDLRFCGPLSSACAVYVWSRAMGPKVGGRPSMRRAVQAVPRCAKPRRVYGTQVHKAAPHKMPGAQVSKAAPRVWYSGTQSRAACMILRYAKPRRAYGVQVCKAALRWLPGAPVRKAAPRV